MPPRNTRTGTLVVAAILLFAALVALGRALSRRSTDPRYPTTTPAKP